MQQINRFVVNKNTQYVNAVYSVIIIKRKWLTIIFIRNLYTMKGNNNKKKITIRY